MIIYNHFLQKKEINNNKRHFFLVINGNIGFNNYKVGKNIKKRKNNLF